MKAVMIDAAGYFVSDIYPDQAYNQDKPAPLTAPAWDGANPYFRPRWNGHAWEEGADPAVIQAKRAAGKATTERAWRDRELQRADIEIQKLDDAYTVNGENTASAKAAWRAYRIQLRDMPQQSPDPLAWIRPEAPQ